MKCIVCGEEAEYILVHTKIVPMFLTVASFVYGGSMCKKCFLEQKKKAQEEIERLATLSKKIEKIKIP